MATHSARSLKSKLLRITAAIMLLMSVLTLTSAASLNYISETQRLVEVERHIRDGIAGRGATLTESHALALKSFVSDNAFSKVRALVARAIRQDRDAVYGLFLRDNRAWAYSSPTTRALGQKSESWSEDAWRETHIALEALRSETLTQRTVQAFGKEILEFAAPVLNAKRR